MKLDYYFSYFQMLGSSVTKVDTSLNIIYPVRRTVFSQLDLSKTPPGLHCRTVRTGMQQQEFQFVIATYWDPLLLMMHLVGKTIAFVIVAMKWKERQIEHPKK